MSRLPPPPPPAGFGPGTAGPLAQTPVPFVPAGYPPPSHAAPPSPYGAAQPQFAPKARLRKTPEMRRYRAVDTIGTIVAALFATWIPLAVYSVLLSLDQSRLVHTYGANI